MFTQKRTISSSSLFVGANLGQTGAKKVTNSSIILTETPKRASQASTINTGNFIPRSNVDGYDTNIVTSPIVASAVAMNSFQTVNITQAFAQLNQSIISRGTTYANNTLATRRGFIAENFTAESYNIDAVIKKIQDRAVVDAVNTKDSADITYDNGQKQASLKHYKDAESSAKAQSNPGYKEQDRIVPADQMEDAKSKLLELARKNDLKGRTEAAEGQRNAAKKIDSTIKGSEGAESAPLTKETADDIAKSFKTDSDGNKIVDTEQLDSALKKTGVPQRVNRAKIMNELRGVGIAAAIGLGIGFTIGFVVSLAQNGLDSNSLKYAFISGAKEGASSSVMAAGSAAVGVAMRGTIESLSGSIVSKLGIDIASEAAKNISTMCSMGVIGSITIIAFSVYNFAKLKHSGFTTKECLLRTGKSAALSFSILIISIVAQGIWGGPAGIIVSITAGVIMTGCVIIKIKHDKKLSEQLTFYSIELCKPQLQYV